jgi:hypothetical protein
VASSARLFSEADRARLAPHIAAIEQRNDEQRARIAAATERLRAKGLPRRGEFDCALRSRRGS